jgi:uncharacterized membrane-anchored protein
MKPIWLACAIALAAVAGNARAQEAPPEPVAQDGEAIDEAAMFADSMARLEAQLQFQQGRVALRGGLARIDVPEGFRYLSAEQVDLVLVHGWGNPPGTKTLGMLFPAAISPFTAEGWGVVIQYDEDGFVPDDDAESIDYAELLGKMQRATEAENERRQHEGYEPVRLVGWATHPRYDKGTHKLYWAKELAFGEDTVHTLNYGIRVLGRRGVLVLNAVSTMDQLPAIERDMQSVLGFTEFNEGHRYADFNESTDKVATYGLAALVAGGVAVKSGAVKGILAIILAFKKLIAAAVVGLLALIHRVLTRGREMKSASP